MKILCAGAPPQQLKLKLSRNQTSCVPFGRRSQFAPHVPFIQNIVFNKRLIITTMASVAPTVRLCFLLRGQVLNWK